MPEHMWRGPGSLPVRVSVVVPVHNAAAHLERCLSALACSTFSRYECVVVDDGSTDASRDVARRWGAQLVALAANRGPAYARNRGAEASRGDLLLFLDADVCVHPTTLDMVAGAFERDPDLAALMGSYDDQPAHPSFLSQYKNLFHHYVHQRGNAEASTFWSGCGAVRRRLLLDMGGFNEGYSRACIEDVELGFRLRQDGHRIRLERRVQVKHLKQWRFVDLVKTDLFHRGVPWVALMLRARRGVHDLNLRWQSRAGTALTYLLAIVVVLLASSGHARATLSVLGAIGCGVFSAFLYDRVPHRIGRWASLASMAVIAPAVWTADGCGPLVLLPLAFLLAILVLHTDFYRFWVRTRGVRFAVGVVPFHLLYFLYSGLALPLGVLVHLRDSRQARRCRTGPAVVPNKPLEPWTESTDRATLTPAAPGMTDAPSAPGRERP